MDMQLADKAHRLAMAGKSGPEIAKAIGVKYAADAHALANVGSQRATIRDAKLTEPELLLLRCLFDAQAALLASGQVSSPKTPDVACLARKSSSWPNATAAKRMGSHRKTDNPRALGSGLNLLEASRNGHIWLKPAGWAMCHALGWTS